MTVEPGNPVKSVAWKSSAEVWLERNPIASPLAVPSELRIIGMARMPRGNVVIEAKIRPRIAPRPAGK